MNPKTTAPTAAWLPSQTKWARKKLLWAWLAPLLAGGVLVWQAWLLAGVVHALVVTGESAAAQVAAITWILLCILVRAGLLISAEHAANGVAEEIKLQLRRGLWRRLLATPLLDLRQRISGQLASSLVTQVEAIEGFFARYLPAMYTAALLPLLLLAFVLPVDWVVGLLLLFSAPLIPVFMALIGSRAQVASEKNQKEGLRLAGFFADRLRGIFTLGLLGRRADELQRVHQASQDLKRSTLRVLRIAFISSAVLELFAALGVAGAAVYIGLGYLGYLGNLFSGLTLQQGLFCLLLAPEVYQPLRQLAVHYHDRADARAALEQLELLWGPLPLHTPVSALVAQSQAQAEPPPGPSGRVALSVRDARLLLPGSDTLLVAVPDLSLQTGTCYALMGESGSGKTSLLEALVGLRPFACGQRIFAGQAVGNGVLTLHDGFVLQTQRPFLPPGSVAQILRMANAQATESQLWTALERAQAAQFVHALPAGLHTVLGQQAFGLSGGQAQRLALARVFLSTAQFVLLDEPTAHLDAHTRDAFLASLFEWGRDRCLLIATHDRELAQACQQGWQIRDQQLVPL